ncbi:MAG: GAF domain-containing protein [Chloroflexi bacterium]|nr:GAF domain-containing protein [Chloroflexota bacterium]
MDATLPEGVSPSPRLLPDPADRLALLIEVGRALTAAPDVDLGAAVSRLLIPALSDVCLVDALDERGSVRSLVRAHVDPRSERLIAGLRLRWPEDRWPRPRPLRPEDVAGWGEGGGNDGLAVVMPDVGDASRQVIVHSRGQDRLLRQIGLTSCIVAPLAFGGRLLGMLVLGLTSERACYLDDDAPLVEGIGRQVAHAVDAANQRRQFATRETELVRLRGTYDTLVQAARELSHALNNDLTLPIGALELLQARADLAADVRELMTAAASDLGTAEARVRAFHTLARNEAWLPDAGASSDA